MKQLEQSGERLTTSLEYPLGELLPLSAAIKKHKDKGLERLPAYRRL